jgi:glycosyltransferase involved in cell wall biosynthesis
MLIPNTEPSSNDAQIIIDVTHLSKLHITGLERVTLELFSTQTMQPLIIRRVQSKGRLHMIWQQNVTLPFLALKNKAAIFITPGFPPSFFLSLFGGRIIPYIHDVFLATRWQDLGFFGKFYMSAPFKFAVRRLPYFFVNSASTRQELSEFCHADAEIILYRPPVRNVFSLSIKPQANINDQLKFVALGTVEPRKNLESAVNIIAELRAGAFPYATLDIVGKIGWGAAADKLKNREGITLHGYKSASDIKTMLENADFLISTSHNEGLGLPLLEAQYAGLAVIAPDLPVFREVLDKSGVFVNPDNTKDAAHRITEITSHIGWRKDYNILALNNLKRWNALAENDFVQVMAFLKCLTQSKLVG